MELKTRARRWGNSLAIILPKILVESKDIRENEEVIIEIKEKTTAPELFGLFPRKSRKSAQKIKDEMRKGW